MSRPIKFRAWSKYEKTMMNDVSYNVELEGGVNPWIFTQFTGLHDKNGKEIWEGDIVRMPDMAFYGNCQILFGEHQTCLGDYYTSTAYGFYIQNPNKMDVERSLPYNNIEVLGNIYENPELLKCPPPSVP